MKNTEQNIQSKIETITVDRAKELLSKNVGNRKIDLAKVNRIAQSIINGDFIITNQGIGIDRNNVLYDGQHRLSAIIKANQPVKLLVVSGLEPKSRYVIDTGKSRTHADALQISKLTIDTNSKGKTIDYSKLIASASSYIILHQTNRFNNISGFGRIITANELVKFVEKNHNELITSAREIKKLTDGCKYVQIPHMLFVYQMHKFFNTSRITKFINIVVGKENSENSDTCPATKLRNTLIDNYGKTSGGKLNTRELMGLTIDASNKFMAKIEMAAKNKKLTSRPTKSSIVNVKFTGNINDNGKEFFKSIKSDEQVITPENDNTKTVITKKKVNPINKLSDDLTSQKIKTILDVKSLSEKGMSLREIAKNVGIATSTVHKYLKRIKYS